jgi:drug/metabolite transporter (DMT)-like permease
MSARAGMLAAILSSALGGTAPAITRYLVSSIDAVTLSAFRFGIAFLFVLPIAVVLRSRWPKGRDWVGVASLGVLFFAAFFYVYNVSLSHSTAMRGALALSTPSAVQERGLRRSSATSKTSI